MLGVIFRHSYHIDKEWLHGYICKKRIARMNKPQYLNKTEYKFTIFEIVSQGPKGSIKKIVEFTETIT